MTTIKRFTPDYKMHAVRFEAFAREAEHGELVRFDAHQQVVSAVEAERDALAVENAELKAAFNKPDAWLSWHSIPPSYQEPDRGGEYLAVHERAGDKSDDGSDSWAVYRKPDIETPATDTALAAIQAQGVEKFADDLHKTAMALCSVKPDNTAPGAYAELARSFAKKLREAK